MALQIDRNDFCQFSVFHRKVARIPTLFKGNFYISFGIECCVVHIHIFRFCAAIVWKWSPYDVFGVLVSLLLFLPIDMITTGCIFNEWYFLPVDTTHRSTICYLYWCRMLNAFNLFYDLQNCSVDLLMPWMEWMTTKRDCRMTKKNSKKEIR